MKVKLWIAFLLVIILFSMTVPAQNTQEKPVRIAVAGMTHGHVSFILNRLNKTDIKLVGFYEPNREMAEQYAKSYHFDPALIYNDLGKMLDEVKPEAVAAFGSIYEHMAVVEACAPRGINFWNGSPIRFRMVGEQLSILDVTGQT